MNFNRHNTTLEGNSMPDRSFTTTEAATSLGVTKVSIWRYIKEGQLFARKEQHGMAWRYFVPETELRRFSTEYRITFDLSALPDK